MVTDLLAIGLRRQGLKVGILDADLVGASIPRMFNAQYQLPSEESEGIEPFVSDGRIKIMSMSMFLVNETDPTAWYGTMMASAFRQLNTDTAWGELDHLLVDLASGTSDVPMAVLQSLPLDGTIIVSSPQTVAIKVAKKTINMIHQFNGRIIGVVENMAYYRDSTGEHCQIFGHSGSSELVTLAEAPLLAQLALDPKIATLCDVGHIEEYRAEALDALTTQFLHTLAS